MGNATCSRLQSAVFSIRRADWAHDKDALGYVRRLVFIGELAVPPDLEWDRYDDHAVHLLAVDTERKPLATARLGDSGQIGRMAVLPAWRNRGVGSALMGEILSIAREPGRPFPFLNAQVSALPFYQRLGFEAVGEEFLEAGITHRRMILRE